MERMSNNDALSNTSFSATLNHQLADIHYQIRAHIPNVDRLSFALYDRDTDILKTYADSAANGTELSQHSAYLKNLPTLQSCAKTGERRVVNNIEQRFSSHSHHTKWLLGRGYHSSLAVPVYSQHHFIGILFIDSHLEDFFTEVIVSALNEYIDILLISIISEYELVHALLDSTRNHHLSSPRHWSAGAAHRERIWRMTQIIARDVANAFELSDEDIENITQFSRYHDIGKLSIPYNVLSSTEELTPAQRRLIDEHIEHGVQFVEQIIEQLNHPNHHCVNLLREIVAYHHEYLDGSGYPYHLHGNDIPPSARIIAVANIFDALTSHHPHKQGCSTIYALLELEKMVNQGKLDWHCVNALREHQDELDDIIRHNPGKDPCISLIN
ncbi:MULTISPECIES: HD domain-containing phosphohydrolase [Vibrio]|uniref:HD domain-containing protein n=2 Tax=Vibrio TaxID=662 RepID=A0A7X4LGZ9_9VIBR|nr:MULTISPECIES: HD domain-containing phosphohydrolase [Vibrio]MBF8999315.1 HD domain-containing protein [Vibrio nitrifigilis]MZI91738.1 HD domain-containing protein [Vibrio eleionomae]